MFDPENRENRESFFEQRKLSKRVESEIYRALENKKEFFSDIITCPNKTCKTPVSVNLQQDKAVLLCPNCGWTKIISIKN